MAILATFYLDLMAISNIFQNLWLLWLLFKGSGSFGYFYPLHRCAVKYWWNRGLTVSGNAGEYKVDFHKELQRLESVGVKMRFRLPSSLSRATLCIRSCCRKSKNDTLYFVSFLAANNKRDTVVAFHDDVHMHGFSRDDIAAANG